MNACDNIVGLSRKCDYSAFVAPLVGEMVRKIGGVHLISSEPLDRFLLLKLSGCQVRHRKVSFREMNH
jgi:hypothetical protein